ncbi:hypothetical protein [Fulvivirga sp. M361]|uniref:hypothetical protein n=1 Tax=Fulvivirga sp. M361 TaxID=2594266 RepID=UPI00162879A9|nr:hypothetical protein [Fulvivirga sp. M361]
MNKYKSLHLWMIIPFVLMQSGFIDSYWITWSDEDWSTHIHVFSAMFWYILLIVQPFLATHGNIQTHRTWGIIGFFVAGATVSSAVSFLWQDVSFGDAGGFGEPFTEGFFYGIVLVELIMMTGFAVAVIMSIVHRKRTDEHVLWLISTIFYIMMPGLGRGLEFLIFTFYGPYAWLALSICSVLIIITLLMIGWRLKKIMHPAILLGIVVNIPTFFVYWIGQQAWYVDWLQQFMKY